MPEWSDERHRMAQSITWGVILLAVWVIGSILVLGRDVIIPIAIAVILWQLVTTYLGKMMKHFSKKREIY